MFGLVGFLALSTPALSQTPGLISPLEAEAELAFARDDLIGAISLYRRAALETSGTDAARLQITAAWLEHELGRDAAARASLVDVFLAQPDYPFRAELYSPSFPPLVYDAQKKASDERRRRATNAVAAASKSLRARDYGAARQQLGTALENQPDMPLALYNLALVDLYEDLPEQAFERFQKVVALLSVAGGGVQDGGSQNAGVPATANTDRTKLRSLALANVGLLFIRRGEAEEARTALEEAVALDQENRVAWSNLGVARRRAGDAEGAAEAFRAAYRLSPDDASASNNLALAHLDAKDYVAAVAHLRDATRRFPNDASLWLNLGLAQRGLGNQDGSIDSFRQAIAKDPQDQAGRASSAALQLAAIFEATGRPQEALEEARRAVAWRPDQVNGWIYQGLALQALGELESARDSFTEAARREPTRAEIQVNLGSVLFEMRQLADAEAAFRRALAIQPDSTLARDNLEAVIATREGRASGPVRRRPSATRPAGASGSRSASGTRASGSPTTSRPSTDSSSTSPGGTNTASAPRQVDLGVRFSDIDYGALGLRGVLIDEVFSQSAAGRAGLREGDLLLRADGEPLASGEALRAMARSRPAGGEIALDLLRDNRPLTVTLRLP